MNITKLIFSIAVGLDAVSAKITLTSTQAEQRFIIPAYIFHHINELFAPLQIYETYFKTMFSSFFLTPLNKIKKAICSLPSQ